MPKYLLTNLLVLSCLALFAWVRIAGGAGETGNGKVYVAYWVCFAGAVLYAVLLITHLVGLYTIAYAVTSRRILVLRKLGWSWVDDRDLTDEMSVARGCLFDSARLGNLSFWGISPTILLGIDEENLGQLRSSIQEVQSRMQTKAAQTKATP